MDRTRFVYINGRTAMEHSAKVSVFDRGFNYGDGVFETIKAINARPVFPDEHIMRLRQGIRAIGIKPGLLKNLFTDMENNAIERLIKRNNLSACQSSVRITVSRGADATGYLPKDLPPTAVIICRPIDIIPIKKYQEKGVKAVFLRNLSPALPGIKSLNFLPNILGKKEAIRKKAFEGIFVDKNNMVTEGTSTNIFIVSKGTLYTPPAHPLCPIHEGALNGVMRSKAILVARRLGIKVKEEFFCGRDLLNADEAFLTNSIIEAIPLVAIEGKPIKNSRPGEITRCVQGALYKLIQDKVSA